MEIKKAGFYKNWYDIANGLEDSDRLAFYDMIFAYYFTQQEPAQDKPQIIKSLFIAVRANIEADLRRKNGGAPEGNTNAVKTNQNNVKQSTEQTLQNETNKVKVNVNVKVKEKDKEKVNDKDKGEIKAEEFGFLPTYFSFINKLETEYGLSLPEVSKTNINIFLQNNGLDENYLYFVYDYIKNKYPEADNTELTRLFIVASTDWEDLLKIYARRKRVNKKIKLVYKVEPPKNCIFCGSILETGALPNTVECPKCRADGVRTWWEYDGDNWKASR